MTHKEPISDKNPTWEPHDIKVDDKEDVLTIETLKQALLWEPRLPNFEPCVVLHPFAWEDYRKTFNLTKKQMNKLFIKGTYIGD